MDSLEGIQGEGRAEGGCPHGNRPSVFPITCAILPLRLCLPPSSSPATISRSCTFVKNLGETNMCTYVCVCPRGGGKVNRTCRCGISWPTVPWQPLLRQTHVPRVQAVSPLFHPIQHTYWPLCRLGFWISV